MPSDRYFTPNRSKADWLTIDVKFLRNAPMSIQVKDADDEEFWLPKSQVSADVDYLNLEVNEVIQISVPSWLAKEKGLI